MLHGLVPQPAPVHTDRAGTCHVRQVQRRIAEMDTIKVSLSDFSKLSGTPRSVREIRAPAASYRIHGWRLSTHPLALVACAAAIQGQARHVRDRLR
jgi:hypothetical protein